MTSFSNASSQTLLKQFNMNRCKVEHADYSGITALGNGRYAVVNDKGQGGGFRIFSIELSGKGKIKSIIAEDDNDKKAENKAERSVLRDCEGICFVKERGTLFVAGEADQRIIEYDLNGKETGRELAVPEMFGRDKIEANRGFESLTYDERRQLFWTTTEAPLLSDKSPARIVRLQSFGSDLQAREQFAYRLDAPRAKGKYRQLVHGVSDILALPDGRLVVMEREAKIAKKYVGSYCTIKLYIVDPQRGKAVVNEITAKDILPKTLLAKFTTRLTFGKMNFANYEGLCLGPRTKDGRQTILLISDSQTATGNSLYRLKDYIRVLVI